ncbi:MAG: hypothetical protein K1X78_07565 [Verrucomicrobiaceae bacterium]|nr:hypothetical protein [Verrucomicrobiaceae bacterium]
MKSHTPTLSLRAFAPLVAALAAHALFSCTVHAQNAPLRPPPGGFERPLADAPRRGNPGASPTITNVEFKALLTHWADFDANKNARLDKDETPELFAKLFDAADGNHDGALDEKERAGVAAKPAAQAASATQRPTQPSVTRPQPPGPRRPGAAGPGDGEVLKRVIFGDPIFGAPDIPKPAK